MRKFAYIPQGNGYLVAIDDFQCFWFTTFVGTAVAYPTLTDLLAAIDTSLTWLITPITTVDGTGNTYLAARITSWVWTGSPKNENLLFFADFPEATAWIEANP